LIKFSFNKIPRVRIKLSQTERNYAYPFIGNAKDENVGSLFFKAITKSSLEDAKKYVSKDFIDMIDLEEIKDFFVQNKAYKIVDYVPFKGAKKNIKINSLLFKSDNLKDSSVISLYLVMEPDANSYWKICGIDKEQKVNSYF